MTDIHNSIESGLRLLGIDATPGQIQSLARHLELVYQANRSMNLTAIPEQEGVAMHILDSAVGLPFLAAAPVGPFADLGTGAGYPGVPLAILSGRNASLVESVRKKASFLEHVVQDLRLKATVQPVRAEELAQTQPMAFAAVTARALAALPSLVELAAPLLQADGRLICLKGRKDEEELRRGDEAARLSGLERTAVSEARVPGVEGARTVVVYARVGRPTMRLPRRTGMAQRQPLA